MTHATKMFVVALFGLAGALLVQAASASTGTFTVGTFTSTAGIDLSGDKAVVAAENEYGAAVTVGSVNFTAGTTAGPLNTTPNVSPYFPGFYAYNYNSSAFTGALKTLMDPVAYTPDATGGFPGPIVGSVSVTAGKTYQLQLLFWQGDPSTWNPWTISAEGDSLTGFNVAAVAGNSGGPGTNTGVDVTYVYTALDSTLNISITGSGTGTNGAFFNAFLVTELPEPASLSLLAAGSLVALRRSRRFRAA